MGTGQDIRKQHFSTTFVGYDRGQVEAFREEVATVVEQLDDRIAALERQVRTYEQSKPITADQAFAQVARETQRILQVAQDAGARMLQQAREQAETELAVARREHARIVDEGHRVRDKMSEQLGELDQARAMLLRKLYDASAEIERICTAVESDPPAVRQRAVDERMIESRRTGTDLAGHPSRPTEPALRIVDSGDGADGGDHATHDMRRRARQTRTVPARGTRGRHDAPEARDGANPVSVKRDELSPLRAAMIEGLRGELGSIRERLHERLRQADDGERRPEITADDTMLAQVAALGDRLLARAFDGGARAAATECGAVEPAAGDRDGGSVLVEVLDARVGAPIRTLLEHGRAADDPPWVVAERIDGVISDAVEAMVAEIAETELSRAYERGKLATFGQEGAARRWIVSPRGHRRDDRCRRNSASEALPPDEPFPSGEHAPPRFSGCTCTTSALEEELDP